MKRHRIFIAINLPADVKKKIFDFQNNWPELPARWIKKENLHITLAFLDNLSDENLIEVFQQTQRAVSNHEIFSLNLNRICYGPPKKIPPKMVWLEGEKSEELGSLQKDLENNLFSPAFKDNLIKESRPYVPHITLARINQWSFRKIDPEERPQINEEINIGFEVVSVEVMESELKRGGPEYTILESYELK